MLTNYKPTTGHRPNIPNTMDYDREIYNLKVRLKQLAEKSRDHVFKSKEYIDSNIRDVGDRISSNKSDIKKLVDKVKCINECNNRAHKTLSSKIEDLKIAVENGALIPTISITEIQELIKEHNAKIGNL